jgi:YhcN/YlaJ family sporulation lipoprotein
MRKLFTLVLCISFLFVSLAGCQNAAQKPAVPERKPAAENGTEMTASERRVMANRLSKMAENIKGVQKASVVVSSIAMNNAGVETAPSTNNTGNNNNLNSTNPNSKMNTNPDNNLNNKMNNNTNTNTAKTNYSGQIVMVGLTLEASAMRDAATQNKIKSTVANKLKASDRRISQVLVTTDPDLIKRINDVAAGIIEGKPIKNFQKDIQDITSKVKQQGAPF